MSYITIFLTFYVSLLIYGIFLDLLHFLCPLFLFPSSPFVFSFFAFLHVFLLQFFHCSSHLLLISFFFAFLIFLFYYFLHFFSFLFNRFFIYFTFLIFCLSCYQFISFFSSFYSTAQFFISAFLSSL